MSTKEQKKIGSTTVKIFEKSFTVDGYIVYLEHPDFAKRLLNALDMIYEAGRDSIRVELRNIITGEE